MQPVEAKCGPKWCLSLQYKEGLTPGVALDLAVRHYFLQLKQRTQQYSYLLLTFEDLCLQKQNFSKETQLIILAWAAYCAIEFHLLSILVSFSVSHSKVIFPKLEITPKHSHNYTVSFHQFSHKFHQKAYA